MRSKSIFSVFAVLIFVLVAATNAFADDGKFYDVEVYKGGDYRSI